ncbi:MAG: GNAT family N-acetyltransferase [Chloroflexi bacterium]|nr:GNAT family N-acetyltransferase [Chloroflexota bacterium]
MTPSTYAFQADDGAWVRVRPMRADDAPHLVDIFEHLSPESRYLRFHEPLDAPDPHLVKQTAVEMAENATKNGRGWLAFVDLPDRANAPVAGVRWVRLDEETAEIALTVRDDMQRKGIGRELLRLAALDAYASGVRKLIAVLIATNQPVLRLLQRSPFPVKRTYRSGELYVEVELTDDGVAQLLHERRLHALQPA